MVGVGDETTGGAAGTTGAAAAGAGGEVTSGAADAAGAGDAGTDGASGGVDSTDVIGTGDAGVFISVDTDPAGALPCAAGPVDGAAATGAAGACARSGAIQNDPSVITTAAVAQAGCKRTAL